MELASIVTDINGSREIVADHKNGLVVPAKDADSLYYAMTSLVDRPERIQIFASTARKMARRYEQGFVRECLNEFYREVLK